MVRVVRGRLVSSCSHVPVAGNCVAPVSVRVQVTFATVPSPAPSCTSKAAPPGPTNTIPTSFVKVWVKPFIVTSTLPAVAHAGRSTVISEGYGVAIPKSGIAMGAVFENVAVPVQGGVGPAPGASGPPCLLMAGEEPIAPNAAIAATTKKSRQM